MQGSPKVTEGLEVPPGIWKLTVLNAPPDGNQRIVVANVNKGQENIMVMKVIPLKLIHQVVGKLVLILSRMVFGNHRTPIF